MSSPAKFHGFVIGVDIGATHCRAALFGPDGAMRHRLEKRFHPDGNWERDRDLLFRTIDDILSGEQASSLRAVGIGCFGPIDPERMTVREAPNRPSWQNAPLQESVATRYAVPVVLENDANVATYGEFRRGAGRGGSSLLGLTLGTGIGGGFVQDGRILIGASGMAAEVGHIYVGGDGIRCRCGAADCLETYASAEGIKRLYRDRAGGNGLSCHAIFHLARVGDAVALDTIDRSARILGRGIASLQKILDPERIALSGGLSRERDLFVEPAIAEARENVFPSARDHLEVVFAELGTDAGLVGAAELAFDSVRS